MAASNTMRKCAKCGSELLPQRLQGICPKCLTRLLFDPGGAEPPGGPGETPAPAIKGRRFGDYELQEEIGRGGMGVVWRARQLGLDRPVALKLILAGQLASTEEVGRFRRAAQTAARLDHPNIVAVFEVGEQAGQPYFSMQLIPGSSLDQLLRARQRQISTGEKPEPCALLDSPAAAARLLATAARAVHHAHQRGILHRDLKPANILVDKEDEPRITDFGLAKPLDAPGALTQPDRVMGTPNYVSPEQAQGKPDLTTATDVYSLGAVLYHLLTGKPVAQANTSWETLRAVVEREPVRPAALNPRVDRDLETICLKCLAKDPQRRYASADALAEDLDRWLRRQPILARRIGVWERLFKWGRRKPTTAAMAGALAAVAFAGLVGIILYAREANRERVRAQERLWGSCLAQARASRWSRRPGQRFDSLAAVSNAAAIRPTLELRNEAIAALALPDARLARYWQLDPPVPLGNGLVFDAAVERYARGYPDAPIAICRAEDDRELLRLPGSGAWLEGGLCFSPDGRFLAQKHDGPHTNLFCVWNLERRAMILALSVRLSNLPFAFLPDSSQIAVAPDAEIHFYELKSGQETRRIRAPFTPGHLRFDPAGRRLAILIDSRPELVVLDAASGAALRSFEASPTGCAWTYDGRVLASTSADTQVYLWNLGSAQPQAILKGHTGPAMKIVTSPTSNLLVSDGWDGSTRFWDALTCEPLFSLPGGLIWFSPPSPGDQRLGFQVGPGHAGVWELAPARECRPLPAPDVGSATFDTTGCVLVTLNRDGLGFWDAEEPRLLAQVPVDRGWAVLRAPGGKSLYLTSNHGLERRDLEFDPLTRMLRLGAAESLWGKAVLEAALSQDGHTLVAALSGQYSVVVLDPPRPGAARVMEVQALDATVSLSPDGKLLATGDWHRRDLTVRDVSSGQTVKVLPAAMPPRGQFSPDSQYLVVGSSEDYQVYKTSSWARVFRLPRQRVEGGTGSIRFLPDSSVVALQRDQTGCVQLLAAGSWQELATLEEGQPLCFSPDGAKLALYSVEARRVMVWDLRLVRRHLAAIGLDWGAPVARASSPASSRGVPAP